MFNCTIVQLLLNDAMQAFTPSMKLIIDVQSSVAITLSFLQNKDQIRSEVECYIYKSQK